MKKYYFPSAIPTRVGRAIQTTSSFLQWAKDPCDLLLCCPSIETEIIFHLLPVYQGRPITVLLFEEAFNPNISFKERDIHVEKWGAVLPYKEDIVFISSIAKPGQAVGPYLNTLQSFVATRRSTRKLTIGHTTLSYEGWKALQMSPKDGPVCINFPLVMERQ